MRNETEWTTVFVTKYVLVRGILRCRALLRIISGRCYATDDHGLFVGERDFFVTLEKANKRAAEMLGAKLKAMEKQRKKYEQMLEAAKVGGLHATLEKS